MPAAGADIALLLQIIELLIKRQDLTQRQAEGALTVNAL